MSQLKIVVSNVVMLNGGDKAILDSLIASLKEADSSVEIAAIEDPYVPSVERYYPDLPVSSPALLPSRNPNRYIRFVLNRLSWLRFSIVVALSVCGFRKLARCMAQKSTLDAMDRLSDADALISTGGTYLVEEYEYSTKLLGLHLALSRNLPVVLFTQSLGPFVSPLGKWLVRRTFPKLALILLRDGESMHNISQIGVSTDNCVVLPDIVFSAAKPVLWKSRTYPDRVRNVAISVRDCSAFVFRAGSSQYAYENNVAAVAEHLISKHGVQITFVSTCQGAPEYSYDDSVVAARILRALPRELAVRTSVCADFMPPSKFQERMLHFDLLISTRMHGAIQGLNAGTPVIPIAYEFKTLALWKSFGLENHVIPFDETSVARWIDIVENTLDGYSRYRNVLAEHLALVHPKAMLAGRLAIQAITGSRSARGQDTAFNSRKS